MGGGSGYGGPDGFRWFQIFGNREDDMNNLRLIQAAILAVGVIIVTVVTGCVGYVGPDGGGVVVPGPEVTVFGGGFERGRDVHVYSHRGYVSRGFAHGGGFHGRR
jgi:hypothetical protein